MCAEQPPRARNRTVGCKMSDSEYEKLAPVGRWRIFPDSLPDAKPHAIYPQASNQFSGCRTLRVFLFCHPPSSLPGFQSGFGGHTFAIPLQ